MKTTEKELLSEWHQRLMRLAIKVHAEALVNPDMEAHRDAYEDGLTPAEELWELANAETTP